MQVVFICDNNYVMPTVVAISSLSKSTASSVPCTVNVICDHVSDENRNALLSLERENFTVRLIDADSDRYKGLEKKYSRVSISSLLKFSIPEYLPTVDRVLYMDGDVLVLGDLSSLFSMNLDEKYAAVISDGPKDFVAGGKKHAYYGEKTYFNSGVMLLNLKKMREDGIPNRLIEFRLHEYNYFMDQDAFNRVLQNNVVYLGVEYDFLLHLISYQNKQFSLQQLINFYGLKPYASLDELFQSIRVLHYTFGKPWKYFDVPFNEKWMEVYNDTVFKDRKLQRRSMLTEIYNTKSHRIGRKMSSIFRSVFFFINFDKKHG